MSIRKDKYEILLNEFKEEQKKKNRRMFLYVILFSLLFSGITSVASYSIIASNVAYTPVDSNWRVSNTQEAIDDLFDSVGSALVGSVYSYMGTSAPSGYLACDGSVYRISDYPRLSEHIQRNFGSFNYFGGDGTTTFAVPDLRGEFLRGTGTNSHSNQGSGSSVGIHQNATEHVRIIGNNSLGQVQVQADTGTGSWSYPQNIESTRNYGTHYWINVSGSKGSDSNYTYYTARPTNTSVLYIIKY